MIYYKYNDFLIFRLGLDSKILTDIINSSSGKCWSSELYNPVPGILKNVPSSKNYEVFNYNLFFPFFFFFLIYNIRLIDGFNGFNYRVVLE